MNVQKKLQIINIINKSMDLSTLLGTKIKKSFWINPHHKALFGIVQGGLFKDLRIKSLNKLIKY